MNPYVDKAAVYYGTREAGILEKRPDGFEFVYHSAYRADPEAKPITAKMPLKKARYSFKTLLPIFQEVLSDVWLPILMGTSYLLNESDKFNLLMHLGKDGLGPVSLLPARRI